MSSLLVSLPVNALPQIDLADYNIETEIMTYVDTNSIERRGGKVSAVIYLVPIPNSTKNFDEVPFLMEFDCKNRTYQTISTYVRDRITYNEWRKLLNSKTTKVVTNSSGGKLFNYFCN